jgi:hypothetical protein
VSWDIEAAIPLIITALSSGAAIEILRALFGRGKGKADVADTMIKKAMELEDLSAKRYKEMDEEKKIIDQKFNESVKKSADLELRVLEMEKKIFAMEKELTASREYSALLKKVLDKYDISVPEWGDFVEGKTAGFEN